MSQNKTKKNYDEEFEEKRENTKSKNLQKKDFSKIKNIPNKKSTSLSKSKCIVKRDKKDKINSDKNLKEKFFNFEENLSEITSQKNKNYLNINYLSKKSYTNIYNNQVNLDQDHIGYNNSNAGNATNAFEIISSDLYSSILIFLFIFIFIFFLNFFN